jgi:hypothetical protein
MNLRIAAMMLAVTVPLQANAVVTGGPAVPRAAGARVAAPRPPRVISTANGGWPHRYFGTLVGVSGSIVTIRLRSGRILQSDATQAFAAGHYSAPLFPGKPTVVYGAFAANGQFFARIVKRAAPQPESWGGDQ